MTLTALALLWLSWCFLHSLLVTSAAAGLVERLWPASRRWYRLGYNAIALATFAPLLFATRALNGEALFAWQGAPGTACRLVLLLLALVLFRGGASRYDLATFLGLRQLRENRAPLLLGEEGAFAISGVFAVTRHPWYLGSLFFLWGFFPAYPAALFLAVAMLSAYLVVGAWLEERRILAEHGEAYRAYQRQVSMLFPFKWLRGLLRLVLR